jgi:hypothetical protein
MRSAAGLNEMMSRVITPSASLMVSRTPEEPPVARDRINSHSFTLTSTLINTLNASKRIPSASDKMFVSIPCNN